MGGRFIVNACHRFLVDWRLQFSIHDADDRSDRDFKIFVLAVPTDQKEVRVDITDLPERRAVENHHVCSDRYIRCSMWVVTHLLPSFVP
jgi:hypothetical protein